MTKKSVFSCIGIGVLLLLTIPMLYSDRTLFLKWYLVLLALGLAVFPLTAKLFGNFEDRGWVFSKAMGLILSGFFLFAMNRFGIMPFTTGNVVLSVLICAILCWGGFLLLAWRKHKTETGSVSTGLFRGDKNKEGLSVDMLLLTELLFLAFFLLWTYLAAFRPEAKGTEKFMDYGFMAAMDRSTVLPAPDLWYAGESINYYFGGQYFGVFLCKLSGVGIASGYNLTRSMVAGFTFALAFSIVYHLLRGLKQGEHQTGRMAGILGGLLAGGAASLAGNMHYVLYGLFGKVFKLSGYEEYWFPSSTRFIGHNPPTADACIHEFPSYSFVLGDLHAHVVNLMFVLLVTGILVSWLFRVREEGKAERFSVKQLLLDPSVIMTGILVGLFKWTNYWDFIIYLTVALFFTIAAAVIRYERKGAYLAGGILLPMGEMAILSTLSALPFTTTFKNMVSGVALSQYHTAPYQYLILWGLPLAVFIVFTILVLRRRDSISDAIAWILGFCAFGLILIPEIVYVKDIYEDGFARSNTMFKLTYQAFLLFAILMGYAITRMILWSGKKLVKAAGIVFLVLVLLTMGYFPYAVGCWYGNVTEVSQYRLLDATRYLESVYPEDAPVIRYLNENVEGSPVVVEAGGDSYSDYERVSAMTGLPTILGWYVHEWLWRGDVDALNQRTIDLENIYCSGNEKTVRELLSKYDVSYIMVGRMEREKYPDLNETMLQKLGEIVCDPGTGSYLIRVAEQ